jgi:hypothetical protein
MKLAAYVLSRRGVLLGVGGVTASVVIVTSPLRNVIALKSRELVRAAPVLSRMLLSLADADYDEWLGQVGAIFTVGGGVSMKLVSVTPLASQGSRPSGVGRARAFMTKFDVQGRGTMAGELIYTASTPNYGAFKIFLSNSTDPNLPQRMTAVFN